MRLDPSTVHTPVLVVMTRTQTRNERLGEQPQMKCLEQHHALLIFEEVLDVVNPEDVVEPEYVVEPEEVVELGEMKPQTQR